MVSLVKQNYNGNKKKFYEVEDCLRKIIGIDKKIEHVGSTAIPDMYGKNIIDILIGVKDYEELLDIKNKLEDIGYIASSKSMNDIYIFLASTSEETKSGDVHIHLVVDSTDRYSDFITLRNYLLEFPLEAKNYSDFKLEILNNGNNLREDYKSIKSKYVTELLERAREYKNNN